MGESSVTCDAATAISAPRVTGRFPAFRVRLLLIVLLGLPLSLYAEDLFKLGLKAYLDADYHTALESWRPMADEGHATAQYCLGNMYYWGRGVPKDRRQAIQWYRRAAEQGHAVAQLDLGNAYRWGEGVKQDLSLAARWWRTAADQNYPAAQFNLGTLYYFGRGVPRDETVALEWYRKAATNGYSAANKLLKTQRLEVPPDLDPAPTNTAQPVVAVQVAPHEPVPVRARNLGQAKSSPTHATVQAQTALDKALLSETWLMARDPGHYTIQLVAVHSRQGIERYVSRHKLSGNMAYFVSQKNGRPLYALVYGDFSALAPAKQAIGQLPETIRQTGTWIRPFSGVQNAISEAQGIGGPVPRNGSQVALSRATGQARLQ